MIYIDYGDNPNYYSMMNEKEYKNKLKNMYKRAAQNSLRMYQRFSVETHSREKEEYNRTLYPSVTQIGKYDSKQKVQSNKR